MLNKIKIIGKLLPVESKDKGVEKLDSIGRKKIVYFSLLVPNPSSSLTVLRCVAEGDIAEEIEDISENKVVEIKGYLRNEKDSRQILIRVKEINILSEDFENIDNNISNQSRLLGKVITDLKNDNGFDEVLSFRVVVPREGSISPIFFCRIQEKELKKNFIKNVIKGDIVIVEGFLQTKKISDESMNNFNNYASSEKEKISRISSIICNSFVKIDNDSPAIFQKLDLKKFLVEVEKIDFSKPIEK